MFSNDTLESVRGQTQGDIKKLVEVVSDTISIVEKDSKICGSYESNGQQIEYLLHDENNEFINPLTFLHLYFGSTDKGWKIVAKVE